MTKAERIDFKDRLTVRLGGPADVPVLLKRYGVQFFEEAGFGDFAVFDLDRAIHQMTRQVRMGDTPFVVAEIDSQPLGFAGYTLDHTFTASPLAYLWVIYVAPPYRRGPLGRMLLWFLLDLARGDGASAFLATVPPRAAQGRTLCNLLRHAGCDPMGGAFIRRF